MTRRMKTVAAAVAVLSVGMLAACKHQHGSHNLQELKEHVDVTMKKIGVSEEQRTKIGAITDRIIADGKEFHTSNQGVREKVVACLLLDTPNREWLHQTVDDKAKEFTAFAHRTVDSLIEISGTLTTEQRADLKKRLETGHGAKKE